MDILWVIAVFVGCWVIECGGDAESSDIAGYDQSWG